MAPTPFSENQEPDPSLFDSKQEFADALTQLKDRAGLTVRDVARETAIPFSTIGGYFSGRHLPPAAQPALLPSILSTLGVDDPATVTAWADALQRLRQLPGRAPAGRPVPYKGLESFQPEDSGWFFGRQALTTDLISRAEALRATGGLLVLTGPSGSGKSSLLRAGLIPSLPAGTVLLTMPAEPLEGPDLPATVIVDQFEEIFTAVAEPARSKYIDDLRAAADRRGSLVVIGLRADFYERALGYPELARALQHQQLIVGAMSGDEIRQAILSPARKARLAVDDGLVELILQELLATPPIAGGHAPGTLPLLSHALRMTWQRGSGRRMTVGDYRATGGIGGSIAATAERVYESLTADQQKRARRLFLTLVHVGEDSAETRRRQSRAELTNDADPLADILERFIDERLISADADTVEISHEALLWAWPRLRTWIDASRADLLLEQQLTEAAREWERSGRDPSALLRGARLTAARAWADSARRTGLVSEFLHTGARWERRRIRRFYQVIAVLAALVLLAAGLAGVSLVQRRKADQATALATARLVASEADRVRAVDPSLAAELSLTAYRISPNEQSLSALLNSSATPLATRLLAPSGELESVALSPDGRSVTAGGTAGKVWSWQVGYPKVSTLPDPYTRPSPDPTGLTSLTYNPAGTLLAAVGMDSSVHLWSRGVPQPPLKGPDQRLHTVLFSADGSTIAAGGADGKVWVWRTADRSAPGVAHPAGIGAVEAMAYSPDGRTLAVGGSGATVRLLRATDAYRQGPSLKGHASDITSLAYGSTGRRLAIGSRDRTVSLWDTSGAKPAKVGAPLTGATSYVYATAFSPDGGELAIASADQLVRLRDVRTRRVIAVLPHPRPVTSVTYGKDGRTLATTSTDGVVRLWALPVPVLSRSTGHVYALAFSPNGRLLATSGEDGKVWLWDVSDPARPTPAAPPLTGANGFLTSLAFSPDGRRLAGGGSGSVVQLWDVTTPSAPVPLGKPLGGPAAWVESVAFSGDGRTLAAGSDDKNVYLWDVGQPGRARPMGRLRGSTGGIFMVAFSPDRRTLGVANTDRAVYLWNLADRRHPEMLTTIPLPEGAVYSLAFSPDGRTMAAGTTAGKVHLWDVRAPARPRPLGSPLEGPGYVYSVAFSPDGQRLLAAGTERTVDLWNVTDLRAPRSLATLAGATDSVLPAVFAPDGHTVAAGGMDTRVRLWATDPARAAARICAVTGTPLTAVEWRLYVPGLRYSPPCAD